MWVRKLYQKIANPADLSEKRNVTEIPKYPLSKAETTNVLNAARTVPRQMHIHFIRN